MKPSVCLLTIGLIACSTAYSREGNTLQDEFRIYTADIATQCTSVQDQLKTFNVKADPLTGYTLKDAVQSLCVCIPAHLETLKSSRSAEDLARPVSEEEVLSLFNTNVIDKCAAEQMQSMYSDNCPKRFKKSGIDAPKYCACMKEVVSGYTEAETAAIADAAAAYLPEAAAAEKNGQPAPPRPPILESYYRADKSCKGAREGFETAKP